MSWVMAGVAVVGGGIKMYQGYQQKKKGEAMEAGLDKPQFEIPPEIEKNMSMAEKLEYQGLPPEQKQAFLDNQQRALQAAMRSSSDRRGGLGIISQIQGQQNISNRQLMLDDIKARQDNMKFAMQQREVMAGYKMKRFEHEYNEYSADLDYARAITGAGMQTQQSGMNQMITGVAGGIAGGIAGSVGTGAKTANPELSTTIGGDNNQLIGGTGYSGGAFNSQNYSLGSGGSFQFNQPQSAFSLQNQRRTFNPTTGKVE